MNPLIGFTLKCAAGAVLLTAGMFVADAPNTAWAQAAPAATSEEVADDAVVWSLTCKGDITSVVSGGASRSARYLDSLEFSAEVSLEDLFGWTGAKPFGHLLSNSGSAPNDIVGAPSDGELAVESTYADKIGENLTLQPDLQFLHNPGAGESHDAVVVATLRAAVEYWNAPSQGTRGHVSDS